MNEAFDQGIAALVKDNLREVENFPEKGVLFRDISPLLANGPAFRALITRLAEHYRGRIDAVAGLESRGFLLAAPLAAELEISMILIRKAGKLPGPVLHQKYDLEYGSASMELQPDFVPENSRVLVLDDVLATGGTASASANLLTRAGATVEEILVLMELTALDGRKKLDGIPCRAVLTL